MIAEIRFKNMFSFRDEAILSFEADRSKDMESYHVVESVYAVIVDRMKNPKEDSYTNAVMEKGIDEILKKLGHECTEIILAAKNPDSDDLKFEISDFMYHCMILMAQKNITWAEIAGELAQR